jgi:predicted TIM-barrel fold metal-dependent hydrolase
MLRREFVRAAIGTATAAVLGKAEGSPWGTPILDIHLHTRREGVEEIDHLEGSGVRWAVLLPGAGSNDRALAATAKYRDRFVRFTNADVQKAESAALIRAGLNGGAIGIGELKYPVQVDGPDMRRVYDIAGELHVPVLIHFEEGGFNSGIRRLPDLLKSYPKTIFIGHGQSWWANIGADVAEESGYPAGLVKPGGLIDKLLADYPNVYGDLSANSGRNALARDPEFAAGFLSRHSKKLMFGSDCPCRDGRGAGQVSTSPALKDKCIARETLTLLKRLTTPDLFETITWNNGTELLHIKSSG